jgi:hypothetical protein
MEAGYITVMKPINAVTGEYFESTKDALADTNTPVASAPIGCNSAPHGNYTLYLYTSGITAPDMRVSFEVASGKDDNGEYVWTKPYNVDESVIAPLVEDGKYAIPFSIPVASVFRIIFEVTAKNSFVLLNHCRLCMQ